MFLGVKKKRTDEEGKAVVRLPLTSHLQACFGNNLQKAHAKLINELNCNDIPQFIY